MQNYTNSQTQKFVDFAHPLCVTLCKIVVDSNYVHTFACECIEICWQSCNQSFTFTCIHLSNTTLVQNNTTDDLYVKVTHIKHTCTSLANNCKSIWQNIVCSFAICKTLFENCSLCFKFAVTHRRIFVCKRNYFVSSFLKLDNFFFVLAFKKTFKNTHNTLHCDKKSQILCQPYGKF